MSVHQPLKGLLVLEFCQYLSGPSAGLRLADLGARVIKIERPGTGDAGRKLAIKNLWADDNSLLFHTINRNKESVTANLKKEEDRSIIIKLIAKADVLMHNFRPEVMERNGLGYADVKQINPRLVYAAISGYGTQGPWKHKPGQDLLVQAMAGLAYTTGNAGQAPVPFGISVADIMAGSHLVQGILAALIRRHKSGEGMLVEVSMLESMLDFQFELLTTYFASGQQPVRSAIANGQPLLSAPYGIYQTADGYIALAMMNVQLLAAAIECPDLNAFEPNTIFMQRDEIKIILGNHLLKNNTQYWLQKLQQQGLWAMPVLTWHALTEQQAYQQLQMEQVIDTRGNIMVTTRCAIRINQQINTNPKPAPHLGEHKEAIEQELEMV
ncbi:MAG TPA: CaiB/BaiF CoA-transferase family protein [Phnomibacter sp.]|nr:CaiB/BaiF CoA-transferase family protein [Phnomibacter sp.]